jgi:hypothetical protein
MFICVRLCFVFMEHKGEVARLGCDLQWHGRDFFA